MSKGSVQPRFIRHPAFFFQNSGGFNWLELKQVLLIIKKTKYL